MPPATHARTESTVPAAQCATRVLIVDDEESSRRFAERVLRLAGYEPALAADGPAALRLAEGQPPFDLLLADVAMPGMRGDELARLLRGRDPDLKILYFTGYGDQLFGDRQTLWEGEAFIEKPVTVNGLLEAVSLMLFGHTRQGPRGPLADLAERRSPRVATAPLQVRIGETVGRLLNISTTGALVRMPEALVPESDWSARIELDPEWFDLRARVVRSHPLSIPLADPTAQRPEYAVALAFTELPPRAKAALQTLCAASITASEGSNSA